MQTKVELLKAFYDRQKRQRELEEQMEKLLSKLPEELPPGISISAYSLIHLTIADLSCYKKARQLIRQIYPEWKRGDVNISAWTTDSVRIQWGKDTIQIECVVDLVKLPKAFTKTGCHMEIQTYTTSAWVCKV